MDAARKEKREHGTALFPFQIYPALDGSEAHDSDFIPYHWHPEIEIIIVESGNVSITIAERIFEGETGDVFFVNGEELHEIRAAGRENQFLSFVFAPDFLQFSRVDQTENELMAPLAEGSIRFDTCLRKGQAGQAEVFDFLKNIKKACTQKQFGYQLTVKAALLQIIAVCAQSGFFKRQQVKPNSEYKARQQKDIVSYLSRHFAEPLSLNEVSSKFGLSPQYFCAFFKENFGKTLTQHINSLRIEQAARLLRETDLPVMEVGFQVGFDNFSYFIKRFRAVYEMSPSVYRKENENK